MQLGNDAKMHDFVGQTSPPTRGVAHICHPSAKWESLFRKTVLSPQKGRNLEATHTMMPCVLVPAWRLMPNQIQSVGLR